jgi:hypothetical protein
MSPQWPITLQLQDTGSVTLSGGLAVVKLLEAVVQQGLRAHDSAMVTSQCHEYEAAA